MSTTADTNVTVGGATVLDTPAQIGAWRYLSAVSQLSLEIRTGHNYYGKRSVYAGIRGGIIPAEMLPKTATRENKVLALTLLCYDQPSGEVIGSARALLATIADTEGIVVTIA